MATEISSERNLQEIQSIVSSAVDDRPRRITLPEQKESSEQLDDSFLRPNLKKAIAKAIKSNELLTIINNQTNTKEKAEEFIKKTIPETPAPSKRLFEEYEKGGKFNFDDINNRLTLLSILRRADIPLVREDLADIDTDSNLGKAINKFVKGEYTTIPSKEERRETLTQGRPTQAGAATPTEQTEEETEEETDDRTFPSTPDQPTTGEGREATVHRDDDDKRTPSQRAIQRAIQERGMDTGAEGDGVDETKDGEMQVDGEELPLTEHTQSTDNPTGDATGVLENRTSQEGQGIPPRQEEAVGDNIGQPGGEAVPMAGATAEGAAATAEGAAATAEGMPSSAEGVAEAVREASTQTDFIEGLQEELAQTPAPQQVQEAQQPMEEGEGETFESVSPQPSPIDLITASGLLSKPKYHGRLIQNARELVGQHDHLKGLKADDLSKLDNKDLHELIVLNVKLYGRKIGVKKVFTKPTSKRADLEQEYHEVSMLIHFWYSTKLGVGTNQPRVGMLLPQSAIGGLAPLLEQLGQLTQGGGGMGQQQEHPAHTQYLTPKQQLQRNLAQATGQPLVEQTPTQPREIPREQDRPRNRPFDLSSRYGVKDRVRRNIMNRAGMSEGLALNFG